MARVYISSTYEDLIEERRAAIDVVTGSGHQPVAMEFYKASNRRPLEVCLEDVRNCEVYVGIFAWKAGFIEREHDKSITQLEYEEAVKNNIPCFLFLQKPKSQWGADKVDDDQARIKNLRASLETNHMVSYFADASSLSTQVLKVFSDSFSPSRPVPKLLPYLPDREEQELEFADALEKWKPSHPLVCIFHGDEDQSHQMLLERFRSDWLPRLLHLDDSAVTSYPLGWPSQFGDMEHLKRLLLLNIRREVPNVDSSSPEEINQALSRTPGPVLVHTHVLTDDWRAKGNDLLKGYLKFWNEWPELAPRQKLIAALFVQYQPQAPTRLLNRLLGRQKDLNAEFEEAIRKLSKAEFDRLTVAPLSKLRPVTETHVVNWAQRQEVSQFCDSQLAVKGIRAIFDDWKREHGQEGAIPMEHLAEKLKVLLSGGNPLREKFA